MSSHNTVRKVVLRLALMKLIAFSGVIAGCDSDDDSSTGEGTPDAGGVSIEGDRDEDGVLDEEDNCPDDPNADQADEDDDNIGDACDTPEPPDADGDGVPDGDDNCPDDANPNQADADDNGIGDACDAPPPDADEDGIPDGDDNCPEVANPDQADADDNGVGDACEPPPPDRDEDGVPDAEDNCPDDANADQADADDDGIGDVCDEPPAPDDTDEDGIADDTDNCVDDPNADQADLDEDGIGDVCDDDDDGDGVNDDVDNCPIIDNADQANADEDDAGDACDVCPLDPNDDVDDDQICGDVDLCPDVADPEQLDGDGDGIGDLCDACPADVDNDADEDMVCGDVDLCPDVADPEQLDGDGDGIGDACDVCPADPDNDADMDMICGDVDICPDVADPEQLDSDGDGFGDACPCPEGTWPDFETVECRVCPAAPLDSDLLNFEEGSLTGFNPETATITVEVLPGAELVYADLLVEPFAFDAYGGYDGGNEIFVPVRIERAENGRQILVAELGESIDVYAEGIGRLSLSLEDACGDIQDFELVVEIEPIGDGLVEVRQFRAQQCFETDIQSQEGNAVLEGNLSGQGRDHSPPFDCVTPNGEDVGVQWTAPRDGFFRFDLQRSDFDTVMYVLPAACMPREALACNDDDDLNETVASAVELELLAEETVIIVIGGYGGEVGNYVLNINELLPQ
ncbi:MAG: thrombospondin type 3 repeat-containing protein [Bradymonadia bacterium]